jgi:hypothetical protein
VVTDFSDQELKELEQVAHGEFEEHSDAGWTVIEVRRGSDPGWAELVIESRDQQRTVVLVDRSEFEGDNYANSSRLSYVAYNFSIRLLEYNDIRGFEEFSGRPVADLELYPGQQG